MSDPFVSIVTPSYNQGEYIEQTILSLKNQDFSSFEHIVVDGGSSDQTVSILKEHEDSYPLRWISESDEGPADACNKGFTMADGEVLAYLNSDDFYLPGTLSTVADVFERRQEVDVVYGNVVKIDRSGQVQGTLFSSPLFSPWEAWLLVRRGFNITQPASFWRKTAHQAVGGFNAQNQTIWDAEFYVDLALQGATFQWLDECLAAFRRHPGSIGGSGRLREVFLREREELFNKVTGRSRNALDFYVVDPFIWAISQFIPPRRVLSHFRSPRGRINPVEGVWGPG